MFEFIDYNDIIRQITALNSTTALVSNSDSNDENDIPISRYLSICL